MSNGKFDLDANLVRKLAKLLGETGLSEIEYAEGDKRIRCATAVGASVPAVHQIPVPPPAGGVAIASESKAGATEIAGRPVTSPMVGTVYLSPEPGKPAFVKKGDKVKEGDTLLIIEAMKVMNPIKAPVGGTIADVLASDTKPVEFGEILIVIA